MAGSRSNPLALEIARSAQELHEAQFGEKSQMDAAKLSLNEQTHLVNAAKVLEAATVARAKLQDEYRKRLTSAAAISAISQLNPRDKDFEKQWGDTISKYADGLDSKAVGEIMAQKRADYTTFRKAQNERTAASFGDPVVSAAYQKAFDQYGDPKLASIAAEATKQHLDMATKLAASPHLSPEDKTKIYNPQNGEFNLDPTQLRQLEIKHDAAAAAQKNQIDLAKVSDFGVKPAQAGAASPAAPEWKQLADRYLPSPSTPPAPASSKPAAPSETPAPTKEKVATGLPGGNELEAAEAE